MQFFSIFYPSKNAEKNYSFHKNTIHSTIFSVEENMN